MFNSRLKFITLTALCWIAIFAFVVPSGADEVKKSKDDRIASVNGKLISAVDFNRKFEIYKKHYSSRMPQIPPTILNQLRAQVTNEMIDQELLYQESQKQKITVDMAMVEKAIAENQKRFPSLDQYKAWLKQLKFSEGELKAQLTKDFQIRELIKKEIISKINIKPGDAKAYFEGHPEQFQQQEAVRARHILIKVDPKADDKTKTMARQKLSDIKKKILAGEKFAELAKAHSQGPSSVRGGDLNYFKRGQMVKPFEEVAFKLAVNEVSDIVETRHGYHLIKVLDHKEAKKPKFEEVKAKASEQVRNERFKNVFKGYIEKLRGSAKIETFKK